MTLSILASSLSNSGDWTETGVSIEFEMHSEINKRYTD